MKKDETKMIEITSFKRFVAFLTIIFMTVLILVGGYFYMQKTGPQRAYKAETKKLRLMKEHQTLQLEVMELNAEIARLQAEAEKNTPTYELTPKE